MSTHKERSRMDAKYIMLLSPTDNTRRLIQKASKTREKPTRTYSRLDGTHQLYTNAKQHIPIFPSPTLFISTHTRRTRNDTVIFVVSINDDDRKRKQKGRAPPQPKKNSKSCWLPLSWVAWCAGNASVSWVHQNNTHFLYRRASGRWF